MTAVSSGVGGTAARRVKGKGFHMPIILEYSAEAEIS